MKIYDFTVVVIAAVIIVDIVVIVDVVGVLTIIRMMEEYGLEILAKKPCLCQVTKLSNFNLTYFSLKISHVRILVVPVK